MSELKPVGELSAEEDKAEEEEMIATALELMVMNLEMGKKAEEYHGLRDRCSELEKEFDEFEKKARELHRRPIDSVTVTHPLHPSTMKASAKYQHHAAPRTHPSRRATP